MTYDGTGTLPRVVCFGEVLLRLTAPTPQLLFQDMVLVPSFCGAEANVSVNLAGFGHVCRLVTALPSNSVGHAASRAIGQFGVDVAATSLPDSRMGLYFLEQGAMSRPAHVTYDRAGSAYASVDPGRYNWASLLHGAEWLFVSGITAALGDMPLAALRSAMAAAKSMAVKIAFDTNFRPALWHGREAQAAEILRQLSCQADLLFAGRRATAMMLGGDYGIGDPDRGFHEAAEAMFAAAPGLQHMAATRRVIHSSDRQDITALIADRDGMSASDNIALEHIVDRVGTGDAFAAGVLHGLMSGRSRAETVRFAAACSSWAHSVPGDFMRASLADIEHLASGSRDVRR